MNGRSIRALLGAAIAPDLVFRRAQRLWVRCKLVALCTHGTEKMRLRALDPALRDTLYKFKRKEAAAKAKRISEPSVVCTEVFRVWPVKKSITAPPGPMGCA